MAKNLIDNNLDNKPLSIYVHIPWCIHKCPYCDFNSHELRNSSIEDQEKIYTDALLSQIAISNDYSRRTIHSIFFGGGTPSLFSPDSINRIILAISHQFKLMNDCEITLEANPGTMDKSYFEGYKQVGVNRVSLGIQSFNNGHLKILERIHDKEQAFEAAQWARKLFSNINLDLMFALPNQTQTDLLEDINTALAIKPDHISYYHLTIEPNTIFHKFPPSLPSEDDSADMGDIIIQTLAEPNFHHYETSAFAKEFNHCRHNMNYWEFGDYLGFGAGAHSKITLEDNHQKRFSCYKNPSQYIDSIKKNSPFIEEKLLTQNELIFEFMMNALRLNQGFKKKLFSSNTGISLDQIKKELDEAKDKKLLVETSDMIKPTILGQQFLNELLQIFMRDH